MSLPPVTCASTTHSPLMHRFSNKMFRAADVDDSGSLNFDETYELVLHMYIQVNRHAPVPPPTRRGVWKLFGLTDRDASLEISEEEFRELVVLLLERALSRVVAFQVATLVGAPLVTEGTMRWWLRRERNWLPDAISCVLPEKYASTVTSRGFARTVLLIVLVKTLGHLVLALVDSILALWLKHQETKAGKELTDDDDKYSKPWLHARHRRGRRRGGRGLFLFGAKKPQQHSRPRAT